MFGTHYRALIYCSARRLMSSIRRSTGNNDSNGHNRTAANMALLRTTHTDDNNFNYDTPRVAGVDAIVGPGLYVHITRSRTIKQVYVRSSEI